MPPPRRRGRYIAERDWPDFRKLLGEFRAVGRTLRRPGAVGERRTARGQKICIAKPDQIVSAGALTPGNNSFSVYSNMAGGGTDTGRKIKADVSTGSFTTDDFVILTWISGEWFVSCYPGN